MAGVGWVEGRGQGCVEKKVRWQGRVCGVATNKYPHMAHTTMLSSYVFNFGTAFMPSICSDVISFSGGGANAGISFRDEGKMLTVHSSEILRFN